MLRKSIIIDLISIFGFSIIFNFRRYTSKLIWRIWSGKIVIYNVLTLDVWKIKILCKSIYIFNIKCSITLLSLLEGSKDKEILIKMNKSIKIEYLNRNIIDTYINFKRSVIDNHKEYSRECFKKVNS